MSFNIITVKHDTFLSHQILTFYLDFKNEFGKLFKILLHSYCLSNHYNKFDQLKRHYLSLWIHVSQYILQKFSFQFENPPSHAVFILTSVHVLCFSEGAAPCPFSKSQNCALPSFRSQKCTRPFFQKWKMCPALF